MGKLLNRVKRVAGFGGAGGSGGTGKGGVGSLTSYTGNILDKNMDALTGKKLRRARNSSGVQELLGG